MELREFLKLLPKYKNILIIVPLVTIIISYFLVRNLADKYVSQAQIATGIVDQTRQLLDPLVSNLQETKVYGDFSNLMEVMKLKKMIDQVSYQLIIHDLTSQTPFRKLTLGKPFTNITPEERQKAVNVFKYKLAHLEPLSLYDPYENELNDMLLYMGYDERSIRAELVITRDDFSDFISVSFTSENPQLSAFVVNTLCSGFIVYHDNILKQNQQAAIKFLAQLLEQKRKTLEDKTDSLQEYKVKNDVLNLEEQSKTISNEIAANQDKLLQAQKDIQSYRGAIDGIDKKFDPTDRKYIDASISKMNQSVMSAQERLHTLNDQYVHSGFDPKVKASLDSAQNALNEAINQTSDKYITNPLIGKEDLVRQKMSLEVNYDLARYSIQAINQQLAQLNAQFKRLVPLDAAVKTYDFAIDIASKEYQDVLYRYNQTNLQANSGANKLIQVEKAMPDLAQPSKKMLLVILSGIISFGFCIIVLFLLYYFDESIKTPVHLANKTGLPVLGYLNLISGSAIDLRKLWDVEHRDRMQQFKDLLRSIRFEIDQELHGEKVLAITSLGEGEGKTLLAISLAYSYSMINKKVLLIDGNFDNPTISRTIQPKMYVEDIFRHTDHTEPLNNTISVLGNHGGDVTLLEIGDEQFIQHKFDELKKIYDVILIETAPVDAMNKSKEWLLFANKTIAVFETGGKVNNGRKTYVTYLKNMEEKFAGWVLNKTVSDSRKRSRK